MTKENIQCFLSEVGHKNFYYPAEQKAILKKDCYFEKLPWVGPKTLIAVKTKIGCLSPLSLDKKSLDDILFNRDPETIIVVWVDKNIPA